MAKKDKKAFVKFFSNNTVAEHMQKLDNIEAAEVVFSHAPKALVGLASQSLVLLASVLKTLEVINKAEASDWIDVLFGDNTPLKEWLISLFDSIAKAFRKLVEPRRDNKDKLDKIYQFKTSLKPKKRRKYEKLVKEYRSRMDRLDAELKAMRKISN